MPMTLNASFDQNEMSTADVADALPVLLAPAALRDMAVASSASHDIDRYVLPNTRRINCSG